MELMIESIEFVSNATTWHDEGRLSVWDGKPVESLPEYEVEFIYIKGRMMDKGIGADITVYYDYKEFENLTLKELKTEVESRITQFFSENGKIEQRVKKFEKKE